MEGKRKRMNGEAILAFLIVLMYAFRSSSATLSTKSRWIVDEASGKRVKLACVNWPSALQPMIAEGLEKKPLSYIAKQIPALGFNCVRFTWATYMFTRPDYSNLKVSESLDKWNLTAAKAGFAINNPEFLNTSVVDLHMAVVNELGKNKVMVVLDNHVSQPGWCCDWNDGNAFFGDEYFSPGEWVQGLVAVARAYKGNAAVVGMSLRNELRGNRQNVEDWHKYMTVGTNAIHAENPDVLVIVSGLSFAGDLGFLKSEALAADVGNKLVFEAHWFAFGNPADKWVAQTNLLCGHVLQQVRDDFLFLIAGDNGFPLFLSEFGVNQNGENEADNRYIGCLMAAVAETDIDWALWSLQGSYMLREGKLDLEEVYGVFDLHWERPRNPAFLQRLHLLQRLNQDLNTTNPTYHKMFHPLSGKCVRISKEGITAASCEHATRFDLHQDGGSIKLAGSPQCLGLAGDGAAARVSEQDCASNGSMWKFVSSSGLHLAARDGEGKYLCLEMNATDSQSQLVTNKCMCVGDDLADTPTCADNPQPQWFKLVPTNQLNKALSSKFNSFFIVILFLIHLLFCN